jgi:hypothetical protein
MKRHPAQLDFFGAPVFPVREATDRIDIDRYRAQIKRAMARAIRECPYDRPTIAARMARFLGLPDIRKSTLDAWTAESKNSHDITIVRFTAFVEATGAKWLWDEVAKVSGVTVLIGDEAHLAEIARIQQERRALTAELKALQAVPVNIRRKRG